MGIGGFLISWAIFSAIGILVTWNNGTEDAVFKSIIISLFLAGLFSLGDWEIYDIRQGL